MNKTLGCGRGGGRRGRALSLLALGLSAGVVLVGGATVAQAATECPAGANTWTGNAHDGSWGTPGNWSQGNAPGTSSTTEDVCLPDSATPYSVTLVPFQYINNTSNPPEAHLSANSLTVGNEATLVIHGASSNGNYSSAGNDTTSLALASGGSISTGGTLELLATDDNDGGGVSDNGGRGSITGGTLTNAGTITSVNQTTQGSDVSHQNELGITLQNAHGATLAVTGGTLVVDNAQTLTNDGTITIAPGAQLNESPNLFAGADTFTNAADGTIVAQIAGVSSFGTIHFGGNTTVNLGGALAPFPVNGYAPAVGSAFAVFPLDSNVAFGDDPKVTGTFGAVSGGFAADYSHETTSPAYIGVVYGAAGGTGAPTPTPTPTPTPKPSTFGYGKASVKGAAVRLTLTCSAGGGCTTATIRETIRVRVKGRTILGIATGKTKSTKKVKVNAVVVGVRSLTLGSGRSTTVTVSLNATGRRLLARFHRLRLTVTVATGGKVRKTYTPTVTQHKAKQRKHG